jgi:excinuclease UvrABC nuclease subunit
MSYPEFSGCYALVSAGRVVYVGQSRNVLVRLSNWRNRLRRFLAGKNIDYVSMSNVVIHFDRVKIYPCPLAELDKFEEELILLWDPELNIRKPKRPKVDIAYLAAKAGLDINKWRDGYTETYSPKQSTAYRRM